VTGVPTQSNAPLIAARELSPAECPGAQLERVATAWQLAVRQALHPLDLTHAQFRLLVATAWLTAKVEGVRQSDVAAHANTDPVTTSEVLRTLEQRALIVRTPHPTDRRAKAIATTEAGGALADRALRLIDAIEARFLETGLPEFGSLAKALKKGGRGAEDRKRRP
jgi:DNA-binding MarR family transcriptional regulator